MLDAEPGLLGSALRRLASARKIAGPIRGYDLASGKALSALRHRSREELHEQGPAAIKNRQKIEILPKGPTQLSTTHREVIDLVYYHQRSIEEVDEIIGVPPSTVKTRMFCARKRIPEDALVISPDLFLCPGRAACRAIAPPRGAGNPPVSPVRRGRRPDELCKR
jgi:hypothetical protein